MLGCSPVPQNRVFRRPHRVRESVGPVPSATWTEAADSLPPTRALDTCHDAPEGRDDAGPVHGQAPGPPSRHCRALARRAVVAVMDRLLADRACVARRSSSCSSRLSCSSCPRSVRLAGAASSQGQASARRPDRQAAVRDHAGHRHLRRGLIAEMGSPGGLGWPGVWVVDAIFWWSPF